LPKPSASPVSGSARRPDLALAEVTADWQTALVTLTHDPKLDDPALDWALRSPAFYIGALGSRKTHESRLDRLAQHGFSAADCTRIHGPVGLSIGAVTPAEIAISIMAQITQARRTKA
jgi:xanthine dehydrogenase accessory factor